MAAQNENSLCIFRDKKELKHADVFLEVHKPMEKG